MGRIGLGWEGISEVPIGSGRAGLVRVTAPVIGLRLWLSEQMGLDLGLGFSMSRGTQEFTRVDAMELSTISKAPTTRVFLVRAGVPYAVHASEHFTFIGQAHLVVGYARTTVTETTVSLEPEMIETKLSGYRLEASVQGGAEIHFGFLGIPELTLQGTVGLFARHEWTKFSSAQIEETNNQTTITTALVNDPWDFFSASVAARYYF